MGSSMDVLFIIIIAEQNSIARVKRTNKQSAMSDSTSPNTLKSKTMTKVVQNFYKGIQNLLLKGQTRSIKAKKNIIISGITKIGSIIISLVMVPLTINYVNPTSYGIWITLSSLIGWFSFFDIGFGHGLRNRLAESLAENNLKLAKKYVSTTYAILAIIITVMIIIFLLVNPFLDWTYILNAPPNLANELSRTASIVFLFFCLQFLLKLLGTVFTANQDPSFSSLFDFIASAISLATIYILVKTTEGSLVYLSYAISISPVLILLLGSYYFYKGKYKEISPSFHEIELKLASNLVSLGLKFFIIQISSIVVYSTNNIIISHLFGPEEVTPYNITFKLFSIITMAFTIISTPFWTAFTDAYIKNDLDWIRNVIKKLMKFWNLSIIVSFILVFLSPTLIEIWIGEQVEVSFLLLLTVATYGISSIWHNIFATFLNGISKIKIQYTASIVISIINIPLAISLGKLFGLPGIPLAGTMIFSLMGIIFYFQTKWILNKTASGIWNK